MTEQDKVIFVVTHGEEHKIRLESPLHLASLAAMLDVDVKMVYTMSAGLLLKKGVAENLIPKEGRKSLIETIREAKEAGVKIYVCSPVLEWNDLKREDFIDEVDDIVGGMFLITESLEAKVTYTF
ncbi:MAG: DsrE family protein [Candidatus Heimdallarchaeota archaeon]|nr:DsrE family protein [Candidatus Heimdallarchaeota archaeon]